MTLKRILFVVLFSFLISLAFGEGESVQQSDPKINENNPALLHLGEVVKNNDNANGTVNPADVNQPTMDQQRPIILQTLISAPTVCKPGQRKANGRCRNIVQIEDNP